ncbi:hypothetical protein OSB04_029981 [Centaurea solstitialis]|uniref:F-box/LRR-repeat protein 15-like leucin rich repeat domain-containing protein n=1 Tax=Centaurea solstitialis TaxID=347529 RepID=A0AA38SS14_9ASTR|nr:hypothetical protein OSB04_029981 [Centaurea solstitialis]
MTTFYFQTNQFRCPDLGREGYVLVGGEVDGGEAASRELSETLAVRDDAGVKVAEAGRWLGGEWVWEWRWRREPRGREPRGCISDVGLRCIAEGFSKLEKLTLLWCSLTTNKGLESIATKCAFIKSLDLQGCYFGDEGLEVIGKSCKILQELNLRFNESITDRGFVALVNGCATTLKVLGIGACSKISDDSLEAIGSSCHALESISLDSESVYNKGVCAIFVGCPLLKKLSLNCINVTNVALITIGMRSPSLQSLSLYTLYGITDDLACIGEGCRNLRVLKLTNCEFETDRGFERFTKCCARLGDIELNNCQRMGTYWLDCAGGYYQMAKGCKNLTMLRIFKSTENLHDEGLEEIGKGFPLLKDAIVSYCSKITDVGLAHFVGSCKVLENLQVVHCLAVTANGFDEIISCGKHLKKVLIEKSKVSDQTEKQAASVITFLSDSLGATVLGVPIEGADEGKFGNSRKRTSCGAS